MDNLDLPAILRAYREENGLSMRGMAQILIMSKSAYERLEKGITKPSYEEIQRILKLLDINPDTFREIDTRGKPVGTIAYLKRGLLYGSISTDEALSCFADIAGAIGEDLMLEWAKVESKGYFGSKQYLPPYRWIGSIFEMECEQDGKKFFLNLPSERVYGEENRNSAGHETGTERLDANWPACNRQLSGLNEDTMSDLESSLKEIYGPDLTLIRAAAFIPPESTLKVLLTVQEIILRFLLDVETEIGPNASLIDLKSQKYLVRKLFRKAQETVGSADHLELPVRPSTPKTITLVKGDEDTFCDWLDEHDISMYEQDEFFVILESFEQTPPLDGTVPPEMCAWAKKVTSSNARFREDDEKLINGLEVFFGVKQ